MLISSKLNKLVGKKLLNFFPMKHFKSALMLCHAMT